MKKQIKVWLVAMVLFWSSLAFTFAIDALGLVETGNLGFVEDIWITWILWTVGLGFALAVITRFVVEE
jgi:hypothetical protein